MRIQSLAWALCLTACQASPSQLTRPPRTAPNASIERFSLRGLDPEPSPLDVIAAGIEGEDASTTPDVVDGSDRDTTPQDALRLDHVLRSVEFQFPLILAALEEIEIAAGELQQARGGFDSSLQAKGDYGLQGFYENESTKVSLEQPTTAWGATLFGGYKLGTGNFPVWEGDLKSQTSGEFEVGAWVPLLKGRRIDERRLQVWQAEVNREQANPIVLRKRLDATRKAAGAYWDWVAAGQKLAIAERLLKLAEDRVRAITISVENGELPRLALIENRRLIVERRSILVQAVRKLQLSAIKLSLYWRDVEGKPVIPDRSRMPQRMPSPLDPQTTLRPDDGELALAQRPEVRMFELELEQLRLATQLADNSLLPKLDLGIAASQDFGDDVSSPDDKGPFEFDAAFQFEVPLQRRAAKGKLRSLKAKANKLERELQLVRESIRADVQGEAATLRQNWERIELVRENASLAAALEEAERLKLREGASDLLRVNLREQQTASAASMLVDVLNEYFHALADYRASLGLPYEL